MGGWKNKFVFLLSFFLMRSKRQSMTVSVVVVLDFRGPSSWLSVENDRRLRCSAAFHVALPSWECLISHSDCDYCLVGKCPVVHRLIA